MRKNRCIYFNGIQNDACDAGVNYRECVGGEDLGWGLRLPCFTGGDESRVVCEKCQRQTPADKKRWEDELDRMVERMEKAFPLVKAIKAAHKGMDWSGVEECPVCGGKLYLTHCSLNGHVGGKMQNRRLPPVGGIRRHNEPDRYQL